ncbi:MAG: response regulator, partial [Candidatus Tectomicrobia bacterium]|nr:response regulator [Candidatus Tectomicrobia bacterium]
APDLVGLRVLGVDDNATNRTLLEVQLQACGIEITCVADAPQALGYLRTAYQEGRPYDLVILDMQMPDVDGLQLAHAIKAEPTLASSRLILLSSWGQRGDAQSAREAAIAAYLTKPVRQAQLYDTLVAVMRTSTDPQPATLIARHNLAEARAEGKIRVLLAEDNIVNQKVAVLMLEKLNCRVDAVANGQEALDALARLAYDLVFMDCQMPEMDGYAATAAIRTREMSTGSHIPIIAMTANAMAGDRERCLQAGMDDYISKPTQAALLQEMVEKWGAHSRHTPVACLAAVDSPPGSSAKDLPATLDMPTFHALQEIGEDEGAMFIATLLTSFLDDAAERLLSMQTALQAQDASTFAAAAHTLTSSSSTVGALRLAALCTTLHGLGRAGTLNHAPPLLAQLAEELSRVQHALQQACPDLVAPAREAA